jgi:hypothetical protein
MSDEPTTSSPEAPTESERLVDPTESPFAQPPGAGAVIPYEKGSDEDRAIRRVLEDARREGEHSPWASADD